MVEFDVSLTRDMTPVVYHDLALLYQGNVNTVNKLCLSQLQKREFLKLIQDCVQRNWVREWGSLSSACVILAVNDERIHLLRILKQYKTCIIITIIKYFKN